MHLVHFSALSQARHISTQIWRDKEKKVDFFFVFFWLWQFCLGIVCTLGILIDRSCLTLPRILPGVPFRCPSAWGAGPRPRVRRPRRPSTPRRPPWTHSTWSIIESKHFPQFPANNDISWRLLFPEFWEDSAAQLHSLERLLRDLHVGVDRVHAALHLLQLLWRSISTKYSILPNGTIPACTKYYNRFFFLSRTRDTPT